MSSNPDFSKIAAQLIGSAPLDYSHKEDGSLVVIAPNGQKFRFTSEQVGAAQPKPSPKPKPKPQARRGRPPKTADHIESTKTAAKV